MFSNIFYILHFPNFSMSVAIRLLKKSNFFFKILKYELVNISGASCQISLVTYSTFQLAIYFPPTFLSFIIWLFSVSFSSPKGGFEHFLVSHDAVHLFCEWIMEGQGVGLTSLRSRWSWWNLASEPEDLVILYSSPSSPTIKTNSPQKQIEQSQNL